MCGGMREVEVCEFDTLLRGFYRADRLESVAEVA